MLKVPQMALVGAAGRKSGKTELACSLLRRFCHTRPIVGVKVTPVDDMRAEAAPQKGGAVIAASPDGDYFIWEEKNPYTVKDTSRMLAAGASRVYWLVVMANRKQHGLKELLSIIKSDWPIVCESSSLRLVAEPGVFFLVQNQNPDQSKPSLARVRKYADRIVYSDGKRFDIDLDDIGFDQGRWTVKLPATAIVLAEAINSVKEGKDQSDSGCDKNRVAGIVDSLRPWFKQILLACSGPDNCRFLDLPTVQIQKGQGLLQTIVSSLQTSAHERNLLVGCDVPAIDIEFIKRMLQHSYQTDAVVSTSGPDRIEPALAVYNKSIISKAGKTLASGESNMGKALEICRVIHLCASSTSPNGR